ncbi:50S ribosomal protein L4 [Candidatus Gottesmanbacteria bacterium]|nr:50S ribosomal protein L4 [Candidatus Gottesmanbacteria bacterium]
MIKIKKTIHPKIDVFTSAGKVKSKISLPVKIFAANPNPRLVAQAVHVQRINQRQGTQSSKTRANVSGTTAKIYQQKGTGRARHGDRKAPIFVGGGTAHGPHPRMFEAKLPKKMRRQALFSLLSARYQGKMMTVVDGFEKISGKTRDFVRVLSALKLGDERVLMILPKPDVKLEQAARNLESVKTRYASQLNCYDILKYPHLLFTKDSLKTLSEVFLPSLKTKK